MNSLTRKIFNISLTLTLFYSTIASSLNQPAVATAVDISQQKQQVLTFKTLIIAGNWVATDFAPGKLDFHFAKHSNEWGAGNITKEAYRKRAISLLNSAIGGDILGFTDKEGYRFRYNKKTNEFATGKPDGTVETLFRPTNGAAYYEDQVKKYG